MNRIKAFAYIYKNSLTSIEYYKDVIKTSLGFSFKYFFSLAIISSFLITIAVSINIYPELNSTVDDMLGKVKGVYPEELVISTNGSNWSINLPEPLIIPLPEVENLESVPQEAMEGAGEVPENLIVFDHNGTVEDFENLNTLILVNESNVLVKEANKYDVYPIQDLPNTEFDRTRFDSTVDSIRSFTKYLPYILAIFIFLGTFFYYFVFRMIYLLIAAFITWMGSFLFGSKLNYGQNLQVCIHAMTLPITAEVIINALGVKFDVPFWFAVVNIGFAMVVLVNLAKKNGMGVEPAAVSPNPPAPQSPKNDGNDTRPQEPKKLEDINQPSNMA